MKTDTLPMAIALVLLSVASCAGAGAATPESPACTNALQHLQQQEAAASSVRANERDATRPATSVAAAQKQAAVACLGPAALKPPMRQGEIQPPTSVPSINAARNAVVLPPAVPASPGQVRPPPAVPKPLTITTCDALGCFTSDGQRMERVGPALRLPRGICTTVGTVVTCP